MTIYTVLAPPAKSGSVGPDPDAFVFVKEGFCWPAFYITVPWLLWRRMWLVLVAYVAIAVAIASLIGWLDGPLGLVILVLFGFLMALEANNLRRWTLERQGFRPVGMASGTNSGEAEFRFFANWVGSPNRLPSPEKPKPASIEPVETSEVVGLFPLPGNKQ